MTEQLENIEKGWLRFAEAEQATGVAQQTLRNWAKTKRIETRLLNGVYQVRLESVAAALSNPPRRGRPGKTPLELWQDEMRHAEAEVTRLGARLGEAMAALDDLRQTGPAGGGE